MQSGLYGNQYNVLNHVLANDNYLFLSVVVCHYDVLHSTYMRVVEVLEK